MRKLFLRVGIIYAMFAVILGAFGAHSLEAVLTPEHLQTFETGIRYQFFHAIALIIVGVVRYLRKTSMLSIAGWLFAIGALLFSGSLYFLAIGEAVGISFSWMGPITPIGGTLLILGWAAFFASTYQSNQKHSPREED